MRKQSFFENLSLDTEFYKAFYKIDGDIQQIRDHYSTVGISKNLMPNFQCYAKILNVVLNFDLDVYVTNGAGDLGENLICDNNKDYHDRADAVYFLNHFYGDIMANEPASNGQININISRFINGVDVMSYNSKWDSLINELSKHFNFDAGFYLFFYKDISNATNPFLDWLTDGIFKGRHPNMDSYTNQTNILSELSSFLHTKNVDLNFVMKTYCDRIKQLNILNGKDASLSEVELPLYIFFNVCRKKRLYWSAIEQADYIKNHSDNFKEAVAYLKAQNCYDISALEKIMMANEKTHTLSIRNIVNVKTSIISHIIDKLDNNISLIKKIVDPTYINAYKKINTLDSLTNDELLKNLLNTVVNNVVECDKKTMNVMQLKSFALSFFYNSLLSEKDGMSKEEYMTKVKGHVIDFLTKLFASQQINFDLAVLEKDIDCLIKNKQFIKTTKLLVKLGMLLL